MMSASVLATWPSVTEPDEQPVSAEHEAEPGPGAAERLAGQPHAEALVLADAGDAAGERARHHGAVGRPLADEPGQRLGRRSEAAGAAELVRVEAWHPWPAWLVAAAEVHRDEAAPGHGQRDRRRGGRPRRRARGRAELVREPARQVGRAVLVGAVQAAGVEALATRRRGRAAGAARLVREAERVRPANATGAAAAEEVEARAGRRRRAARRAELVREGARLGRRTRPARARQDDRVETARGRGARARMELTHPGLTAGAVVEVGRSVAAADGGDELRAGVGPPDADAAHLRAGPDAALAELAGGAVGVGVAELAGSPARRAERAGNAHIPPHSAGAAHRQGARPQRRLHGRKHAGTDGRPAAAAPGGDRR